MSIPGSGAAVRVASVSKRYRRGLREVVALRDLSLVVSRGEFVSLMGPSGSGKSTILNLAAGLDRPTRGEVYVEEQPLGAMSEEERTRLRRTRVGVIFQFFNLLPSISALDNVALPLRAHGIVGSDEVLARSRRALERVGLPDREDHRPEELSGGEMQRVAIARALVIEPVIILADEPTGNLDSFAGADIMRLLREASRERGVTVLLATHSHIAAAHGDGVVTLRDGTVDDEVITRPAKEPPRLRPVS
jgi:putative ABC transport system ATP-binding protein